MTTDTWESQLAVFNRTYAGQEVMYDPDARRFRYADGSDIAFPDVELPDTSGGQILAVGKNMQAHDQLGPKYRQLREVLKAYAFAEAADPADNDGFFPRVRAILDDYNVPFFAPWEDNPNLAIWE